MDMTGMAVDISDSKDAEKLATEMLDLPDKVYSSGRRSSHSRRKSLMLNTPDISGKESDSGSEAPSRRGSTSRRASTAHRRGSFLNIDGKDSGDETRVIDPMKRLQNISILFKRQIFSCKIPTRKVEIFYRTLGVIQLCRSEFCRQQWNS